MSYIIRSGEIVIVDEFTGRTMPGRRWSDGLHQAIEAKEALDIKDESVTLASISYQVSPACKPRPLASMNSTGHIGCKHPLLLYVVVHSVGPMEGSAWSFTLCFVLRTIRHPAQGILLNLTCKLFP